MQTPQGWSVVARAATVQRLTVDYTVWMDTDLGGTSFSPKWNTQRNLDKDIITSLFSQRVNTLTLCDLIWTIETSN